MRIGLGTGSTARHVVAAIGERFRRGDLRDLVCVPTSKATADQADRLHLPLAALEDVRELDLAIDGADEVDPNLDMIKGLGGALLEEKRVERTAKRLVIVVDPSKLVPKLGMKSPLPVEVARSDWESQSRFLSSLGCAVELRGGQSPFTTDRGNVILDCRFARGIDDPRALARKLDGNPGVLAHGLFLGMADEVIVAKPGGIQTLTSTERAPREGTLDPPPRNPALASKARISTRRAWLPPGPHLGSELRPQIVPAVLVDTRAQLMARLASVTGVADRVQIDVMDGRFVPRKTVGPTELRDLRTELELELHLMVEDPLKVIGEINQRRATYLVHVESLDPKSREASLRQLIDKARSLESEIGLALSPNTSLDELRPLLSSPEIRQVLVMTVEPGAGGQALIPEMLDKVRRLKAERPDLRIEVDGGVSSATAKKAVMAGASRLVAGSAVYGQADVGAAFRALSELLS